jgi:subtilisin family serine protease
MWGWMSGTSMSTPAAAGVVALWMQAASDVGKTLTCQDVKDIIMHSCDTDAFTAKDSERFGHGKINAYKGLLYVLGLETAIQGLSKEQPENVTFRVSGDDLYADGAEDGTAVTLYNLSGVLVRQATVQSGAVSLSGLQQGVYAVQLGKLGSTLIRK